MGDTVQVTKEQVKSEVDKVRDEYLGVLYRIILALEEPDRMAPHAEIGRGQEAGWHQFISEMYGSTADAPLERWPGLPEERLALE